MVVESPRDRYVRYQCSSMSKCSSPTYWQKVHHGDNLDLSDEDFVADYISNREAILQRAREARDTAESEGDTERMYHYENIIETIIPLWCSGSCSWSDIWMVTMSLHPMTSQVSLGARQIRKSDRFCMTDTWWASYGFHSTILQLWGARCTVNNEFHAPWWMAWDIWLQWRGLNLSTLVLQLWCFHYLAICTRLSRFLEGKTGWAISFLHDVLSFHEPF